METATATPQAPPAPVPTPPPVPGITAEQRDALIAARQVGRPIRRAALVAAVSGWTMAVFAGFSLLFGLFDPGSFVMGVALGVVAWLEIRGAARMRRIDPGAARHLALNQGLLAATLVVYGAWGLFTALTGPSRYAAQIATGGPMADALRPIDDLHRVVAACVYVTVIVIGAIVPAMTALYYATRRRRVVAFLERTPAWVVESMRAAA